MSDSMPGKLYIVGIGPGGAEHLTPAARAAIEAAQVVCGYRTYLDLLSGLLSGKEIVVSGMRQEVERCRQALALAAAGRTVALVSSGDAGIYGMAGLILELANAGAGAIHESPRQSPEIVVVPGVSAVQAAAACLGAPLMHDFAVVSLSDLLTPWDLIRRRLEAAAAADFVVALYNPRSRGRITQIEEARQILLRHRPPGTPAGIVRNACRPGETTIVTDLANLLEHPIDMTSLVIVGNTSTFVDPAGRMITPRGYATAGQGPRVKGQGENAEDNIFRPSPSALCPGAARALFVGGTGSDVGKSVIAAGLCRILKRQGVAVAPFKAQNMALNSAVTPEGGEIGRAQALQAAACGLEPHADMNPVLLKPNSETGSQVILQGRPVGNMTVAEYHRFKEQAFARVRESFERLTAAYRVVVMEGAGSIAEINLKEHDIANLRAASMADAPVLLVADIDRGGVFAAIVGTLELLSPEERSRIIGVVINRFRGDAALLRPGIEAVEQRTGIPVLGVVPWLDLRLPEEDSVALRRKGGQGRGAPLRIGVVRLPHISNYTDFDPFEREDGVDLLYLNGPTQMEGLDLLILPGSKNTLADLDALRRSGLAEAIRSFHAGGGRIAGICGGYQMLGRQVCDPQGVESDARAAEGLGLLDVTTVLRPEKQTHQVEGVLLPSASSAGLTAGERVKGYEIHMGETSCGPRAKPLIRLERRSGRPLSLADGAVSPDGRVWGSYLHGLFDEAPLREAILDGLRRRRGLPACSAAESFSLEKEMNRLADHLEAHLDLSRIFSRLGLKEEAR